MTQQRKTRSELIFIESPHGGRWTGKLLAPSMDEQTGQPAKRYTALIEAADGYYGQDAPVEGTLANGWVLRTEYPYMVTTQGPKPGSRRYASYGTLTEAQQHLSRWARGRFYVRS